MSHFSAGHFMRVWKGKENIFFYILNGYIRKKKTSAHKGLFRDFYKNWSWTNFASQQKFQWCKFIILYILLLAFCLFHYFYFIFFVTDVVYGCLRATSHFKSLLSFNLGIRWSWRVRTFFFICFNADNIHIDQVWTTSFILL